MSNTNKELLDDLKKVIYESLERYAKANNQELAISNLGNIRYKVFLAIMNWEF